LKNTASAVSSLSEDHNKLGKVAIKMFVCNTHSVMIYQVHFLCYCNCLYRIYTRYDLAIQRQLVRPRKARCRQIKQG